MSNAINNTQVTLAQGAKVSIQTTMSKLLSPNSAYTRYTVRSDDDSYDYSAGWRCITNRTRTRLSQQRRNEAVSLKEAADAKFNELSEQLRIAKTPTVGAANLPAYGYSTAAPDPTPAPAPAPQTSGLGTRLEDMLLETIAKASVDSMLSEITPKLEAHIFENFGVLPKVIEVKTPTATNTVTGVTHEVFEEVVQMVGAGIAVFFTGAAGTGKNFLAKQVADALGIGFQFTNAVTQEYKLSGFIDANGKFQETAFYHAWLNGDLFMLDEIDASAPEALVWLNAALANGYAEFPIGKVDAHPDFRCVAAGNTFGTGADLEYSGRFQLDAASLDRFALVHIDYDRNIEVSIAGGDTELVDFIRSFRNAVAHAGMKHVVSYRAIDRISKLKDALPLDKVLKTSLTKNLSSEDIRTIKTSMTNTSKYMTALAA